MRDDMAKIIVERPRVPDRFERNGRARPLEDLPQHEGMRRPHLLRGWGKELNENLQPLRRYLGAEGPSERKRTVRNASEGRFCGLWA